MTPRWQFGWVMLVLGTVLLGGCARGSLKSIPASARKADPAGPQADPAARISEEDLEKRVAAYANFAAGISAELNEDDASALEFWTRSAQADPGHEVLVMNLAGRLLKNNQPGQAIEVLSRATATPEAGAPVFVLLGQAYLESGRTNLAIEAYRTAIGKDPDDINGYRSLVLLYRDNRRLAEALAVMEDAFARPSTDPVYWVELAELYARHAQLRREDSESARARSLAALKRADELDPEVRAETLFLVVKLADGFRLMGDLALAEKWYLRLADRMPAFAGVREKLADIYLRQGEKEKASDQLEAIVRDNPRNEQVYYLLGSIAHQEKRFEDAAGYYEQTIALRPEFEPAYYELAGLKIALDRPEEALELLRRARTLFRQNFVIEFYTALASTRAHRYSEAVRHFTEAEVIGKAREPEKLTHFFYHQFGAALERKGDPAEAERCFRKSLELSPNFAESLNYLGYMWADRGENLDEALRFIEKAVEQEPGNAAYLDSLAWVLFKLGRHTAAMEWIERAIHHSEAPDPTLYDHLGDICAALERPHEARQAWEKSLALEFNPRIKMKLDGLNPGSGTSSAPLP